MAEPLISVVDLLRNRMTDPNSSNRIGDNWIYPDWPRIEEGDGELSTNSFPRISCVYVDERGRPYAVGSSALLISSQIQIDVWCSTKQEPLNVGGADKKKEQALADYLARQVVKEIDDHWHDDISHFERIELISKFPIDPDIENGIFRHTLIYQFEYKSTSVE